MGHNRDKIEGPLLYDSLDRPNPPAMNTAPKQKAKRNDLSIALIIPAIVIPVGIIIYSLIWLHSVAGGYTSGASFAALLIWLVNAGAVLFLLFLFVAVIYGAFTYVKRNELVSLDDGLHVSAFNAAKASYDSAFNRLVELQYSVLMERAKQSEFQGVTTLTLDRSTVTETSTTSVETGAEKDDDTPQATPDKGMLQVLQDKGLIGRSNKSLLIGFSEE